MTLSTVPKILTPESFNLLIQKVTAFQVCPGNPDSNFMSMSDSRKGKFLSVTGKVNAYEDSQFEVIWNGERYHQTIRTSDCDMVATQGQGRCQSCSKYRSTLRALHGVMESSNPNITANFPEGSFQRLFWDQQIKAARVSNARAMKWHPMMIRWCLNLKFVLS